ncbi:hypothetical protein AMTR_s00100p00153140 [Amborella trichopoda]|uniref:Uncharacterized protein n=1 Tax=Amborella trichopoda TaxID=13333 RepID=W1NYT2_AMBTC|nr:hypothetical protein AMTR_s00100p00153140 [Amborella trichopoda]
MCKFTLPREKGYVIQPGGYVIQPGCFYAAYMMAQGTGFVLAQSVLCGIFHGLGSIAHGKVPSKDNSNEVFLGESFRGHFTTSFSMHYVFGCLSAYFPRAYELNGNIATARCPHMLKIVGMNAVVREPDVVRELLTGASFFTHERPFPVGGPFDMFLLMPLASHLIRRLLR